MHRVWKHLGPTPGDYPAMTAAQLWLFLHILLFVYWLGADLGVLILAKKVKDRTLAFEQRMLLIQMAVVIDALPRLAMAIMFPVGLELATAQGWVDVPLWVRALAWLIGAAWILLIIQMGRAEGGHAPRLAAVQTVGLVVLAVGLVSLGGVSLISGGPFADGWLSLKVLLFGVIAAFAIGIDWAFKPLGPALGRLAQEGSTDEIEAAISASIDATVRWVYLLYATLVVVAFLGVTKLF